MPAIATSSPTRPKTGLKTHSVWDAADSSLGHRVSGINERHVDIDVANSSQTSGNRLLCIKMADPGLLIGVLPPQNQGFHRESGRRLGSHSAGKNRINKPGVPVANKLLILARFDSHTKCPGLRTAARIPRLWISCARYCMTCLSSE